MTPEQFVYWLQGFFEVTDATTVNQQQVKIIKEHLAKVFNREPTQPINSWPFTISNTNQYPFTEQLQKRYCSQGSDGGADFSHELPLPSNLMAQKHGQLVEFSEIPAIDPGKVKYMEPFHSC